MRHGHNAFQYQSSPNNLHFIKSLCNSSMPRIASSCVNVNGWWNVTFRCLLEQYALGNHVGNRTFCIAILRAQIIKRERRPLKIAHANLTGTMKAKHSSGFSMPHSAAMTYPVDVASEPRLIIKSFNAPFSLLVYVQLLLLLVCFPLCFVNKTILTSFKSILRHIAWRPNKMPCATRWVIWCKCTRCIAENDCM